MPVPVTVDWPGYLCYVQVVFCVLYSLYCCLVAVTQQLTTTEISSYITLHYTIPALPPSQLFEIQFSGDVQSYSYGLVKIFRYNGLSSSSLK